jgi:hypothetical protein
MANFADAIEPVQDLGGAVSFPIGYQVEEASQTFVYGVPVMLSSVDGGVQIWDGATVARGIAGFSCEPASNLGSTGAGAPSGFSPVTGPGSVIGNFAANPNQSLAVITPPMVPTSDGYVRYYIGAPPTVFVAKLGTSATVTPVATTNQLVGTLIGLTKDTGNSFWYADTNKNTAAQIVGLDPRDPVGTVGGHVFFVLLNSVVQVFS